MSRFQETKQSLLQRALAANMSRRRFTRSTIGLGVSSLAVASLLQACGGGSGDASSGEITVWTWPDNDKTFEKTTPIFEKKFPDIKVKVQAFDNTTYHDKLLAAIVAGSGPDVAMVEIGNVAKFKGKPGFVDLSEEPYNAAQYEQNYAHFSWSYVVDEQTRKIFTLPKNTGPGGFFYRRDIFEQAGLPSEPDAVQTELKDWDAFIEIGKKIAVADKQWMVGVPAQIYNTMRAQAGVSNYDASGNLQLRHEASLAALEHTQEAWKAGLISPFEEWSAEWTGAIQNGTIATFLYGNWFGGLLKDVYASDAAGKWGIANAPAYNSTTAYNSGGDFIGILTTSAKKQAAWEYIKFVTQDSESLETMYLSNDLYPAWEPALQEEWLNTVDAYYKDQQINQIFSSVQETMVPPVTHENDPVVGTAIGTLLSDITKGNMDIPSALDKAEQQIAAKTGQ